MKRRLGLLAFALALLCACGAQNGTIGAMLVQRPDGALYVRDVPPRLAADKAGLHAGDQILLIDGKDVRAMTEKQVLASLNGEIGTPVRLTVIRGEAVLHVVVKRTAAPPSARRRAE